MIPKTMRTMVINRFGGADVLRWAAVPMPGPGEALVATEFAPGDRVVARPVLQVRHG